MFKFNNLFEIYSPGYHDRRIILATGDAKNLEFFAQKLSALEGSSQKEQYEKDKKKYKY